VRVGYAVTIKPTMASYRLRVAIPAPHLGLPYVIGETGSPTFFYKLGNPEIALQCRGGVVFDVVNDHFKTYETVRAMADVADRLTVGSVAMAETVYGHTGRDATVIDDPYENDEQEPACDGQGVLWFGHTVNLQGLTKYRDRVKGMRLTLCTNHQGPGIVPWSLESERACLDQCAVVLMTGTNPGASTNRVVKAIRAGRFVVCPEDCAESWKQFESHIWVGDVREGVEWALNNREEVCNKIRQAQQQVRDRFSPQTIGQQWADVFRSI